MGHQTIRLHSILSAMQSSSHHSILWKIVNSNIIKFGFKFRIEPNYMLFENENLVFYNRDDCKSTTSGIIAVPSCLWLVQ